MSDDAAVLAERADKYRSALLYAMAMMSQLTDMASDLIPTGELEGAIAEDQEMHRGPVGDGLIRLCKDMLTASWDGYSAHDVSLDKIESVHEAFKKAFWDYEDVLEDHICIKDGSDKTGIECNCVKCR